MEHHYRAQKTSVTDLSFWMDKPEAKAMMLRGDFRQSMTVLSESPQGLRVRWQLSADLPPGVEGSTDSYQLNALYRNSLQVYGVGQLDLDTDATGIPVELLASDTILDAMRKTITSGLGRAPIPSDGLVYKMQQEAENDPLRIVQALVPEAGLLAFGQTKDSSRLDVGQSTSMQGEQDNGGIAIATTLTFTLQSTDPAKRTATFGFKQSYDPAAFQKVQQPAIDKLIASFAEQAKQRTEAQLAQIRTATMGRSGSLVLSLLDGSTLEILDRIDATGGGMNLTTITHLWRDDQPPRLPNPPAWNAATAPLSIEPPEPPAAVNLDDIDKKAGQAGGGAQSGNASSPPPREQPAGPLPLKVAKAEAIIDPGSNAPALQVELAPESSAALKDFTSRLLRRQVQILVDGKVAFSLMVMEPIIDGRMTIYGIGTLDDARATARQWAAGGGTLVVQTAR